MANLSCTYSTHLYVNTHRQTSLTSSPYFSARILLCNRNSTCDCALIALVCETADTHTHTHTQHTLHTPLAGHNIGTLHRETPQAYSILYRAHNILQYCSLEEQQEETDGQHIKMHSLEHTTSRAAHVADWWE